MNKCSFAVFLMLMVLLVACGGGGGGGSSNPAPAPAPPPPPVEEPVGFSISGTVTVSPNLGVDSDTNNPESPLTANDTVATAQPISNPATLGGYVSVPGAGESGAVQVNGDIDDYFRVELLGGQTVTLLVADFEQADADLYLYNLEGEILDSSIETGQLESLDIPADGTYVVNVFAFEGATNYVLAIGSSNTSGTATASTPRTKIVPWQANRQGQGSDRAYFTLRPARNVAPAFASFAG